MGCGKSKQNQVSEPGPAPGHRGGSASSGNTVSVSAGQVQPSTKPAKAPAPSSAPKPSKPIGDDIQLRKVQQAIQTRVLAFRECGLKKVPAKAFESGLLTVLRTADLSINQITALGEIENWAELQQLNAAQNLLQQLPPSIGALTKLQKLVVSKNKLSSLPARIGECQSLQELICDHNVLSALPDVWNGAVAGSLLHIDVSHNQISALPRSLCNLRVLTRFEVQQNKLTSLPLRSDDGGLIKLEYVDAAGNTIKGIEEDTLRLPCLAELQLKGNPIDRLKLQDQDGFKEFLDRRKKRIDAKIDSNVVGAIDLRVCGLD